MPILALICMIASLVQALMESYFSMKTGTPTEDQVLKAKLVIHPEMAVLCMKAVTCWEGHVKDDCYCYTMVERALDRNLQERV